jgi:ribosomal protein S27E
MQEVINCPSCQRRLQVPDSLVGQDVQCPTCGATFVAALGGRSAVTSERLPEEKPTLDLAETQGDRPRRRRPDDDYGDYNDDDYYRRRRRGVAPQRGAVILTLGILSLIPWCIGIILGPIAWAMGTTDLAEMRNGRMDPEGEGITNAGRICGIIGTFISLMQILFFCFLGANGWVIRR